MKQKLLSLLRSPRVRATGAGLAGFVAYGGWGWWVNLGYGQFVAVKAGLVQGSYSFLLTFFSTLLMEWLYARLKGQPFPVVTTTVLTSVLLFIVAFCIQTAAGTPEVLLTILPGYVVGTVYSGVYVAGLAKLGG